jgi:hypothetical protein
VCRFDRNGDARTPIVVADHEVQPPSASPVREYDVIILQDLKDLFGRQAVRRELVFIVIVDLEGRNPRR